VRLAIHLTSLTAQDGAHDLPARRAAAQVPSASVADRLGRLIVER